MSEKGKTVPQELELASLESLKDKLNRLESLSAEEQKEPLKEFLQKNTHFLFESLSTHRGLIFPICAILEEDPVLMWKPFESRRDLLQEAIGKITPILKSIEKLNDGPEKKGLLEKVLTKQNKEGMNALMIAAHCQPGVVPPILESMKNNPTLLEKVLTQQNKEGMNALMIAVRFKPLSIYFKPLPVAPILTAIVEANNHNLLQQVLCERLDGQNALLMAQVKGSRDNYIAKIYIKDIFKCAKGSSHILYDMLSGVRAGIGPGALSDNEYRTIEDCFWLTDFNPPPSDVTNSVNSKTLDLVRSYLYKIKKDLFRIGCKTGEGYRHRFKVEHELIQELEKARNFFFQDGKNDQFIKSCQDALKKAKPELEKHLGWGGFFKHTTSSSKLDAFLEALEYLSPGPPPNPSP